MMQEYPINVAAVYLMGDNLDRLKLDFALLYSQPFHEIVVASKLSSVKQSDLVPVIEQLLKDNEWRHTASDCTEGGFFNKFATNRKTVTVSCVTEDMPELEALDVAVTYVKFSHFYSVFLPNNLMNCHKVVGLVNKGIVEHKLKFVAVHPPIPATIAGMTAHTVTHRRPYIKGNVEIEVANADGTTQSYSRISDKLARMAEEWERPDYVVTFDELEKLP